MRIVDHLGCTESREVAAWATKLGFDVTYDTPQGQKSHECGAIAALTVHTFRALNRDFDALLHADVTAHLDRTALDNSLPPPTSSSIYICVSCASLPPAVRKKLNGCRRASGAEGSIDTGMSGSARASAPEGRALAAPQASPPGRGK